MTWETYFEYARTHTFSYKKNIVLSPVQKIKMRYSQYEYQAHTQTQSANINIFSTIGYEREIMLIPNNFTNQIWIDEVAEFGPLDLVTNIFTFVIKIRSL